MPHTKLHARESFPTHSEATKLAALVYKYAAASANALWAAYDLARESRGSPRGITTDQEQDILRAMLVAAASGLDGALKQLIRDALPSLLKKQIAVDEEFEKFAQKKLQVGGLDGNIAISAKVLARILTSANPQAQLIAEYSGALTGDSLQSVEQLFKTCKALGVEATSVIGDKGTLKNVFDVRNQIIHELDMNLSSSNRKRRVRGQQDMQGYTERLLKICLDIIQSVDTSLSIRTRRRTP